MSGAGFGCSPLRRTPRRRTLLAMDAAREPRRLSLEVRLDAEPIEGRIYEEDGSLSPARPFCGWLGLLAAIDAARAVDPPCDRRGAAL